MCGFAGELRFDGHVAEMAAVQKMNERLRHRGPNDDGSLQRGPLALAHRRLTIIDLSKAGAQPS